MAELLRLQKFFHNAKEQERESFVSKFTDATDDTDEDISVPIHNSEKRTERKTEKQSRVTPSLSSNSNINNSYVAVKNSMNVPNGSTGATIDTYIERVMTRIGEDITNDEKLADVMSKMEAEIHREQDVHSKEQEIRDAVRSKAAFLKSKASLSSSQQQLHTLHRDLGHDIGRRLQEISSELKQNNKLLSEFSEHAKGDFHPEYAMSTMVNDCDLQVSNDKMKLLLQENMADPSSALHILDGLLTTTHTAEEGKEIKHDLVSYGVGSDLVNHIMELHTTLNSDQLESQVAIKSLQKSEESIPRLQSSIQHTEQSCNKAMSESNLESVETLQEESLGNYNKMLALVQERLSLLIGSGRDNITSNVKQRYEQSAQLIATVAQRCDEVDRLLEDDARKLVDTHDQLKDTRTKESNTTNSAISEIDSEITDNEIQQQQITTQILSLQQSYKDLSSSRDRLVTERVKLVEDNECKQRLFETQCRTQQQHLKMMQDVKDHLTLVNQLHKFIDRWVSTAVSGISRKMVRAEADLRSIRLEEHTRHLEIFSSYFLFNGELIFKKAERVREYTRLIRHSECSAKHALNVADPQARVYENYANELSTVRDSCIKKIEFLRENCKKASIEFEATADALAQAGIAFTHPEVLLNKQTAELKKLSVTHRNQLFEADRKDNEEELAELNRLLDQTAL